MNCPCKLMSKEECEQCMVDDKVISTCSNILEQINQVIQKAENIYFKTFR